MADPCTFAHTTNPTLTLLNAEWVYIMNIIYILAQLITNTKFTRVFFPFMQVGPTYGRKTMKGLLASQGIVAGEKQIGNNLAIVQPEYHHRRLTKTEAETNPHLYSAQYFGHKLHIDQNEKLVMFGVTHICAIDAYSRKIVGMVSMPVKNCCEIYNHVMR